MLVMSFKADETFRVTNEDGSVIEVMVVQIKGNKVRLGVQADLGKLVLRWSVVDRGISTMEGGDE